MKGLVIQYVDAGSSSPSRLTATTFSIRDMSEFYLREAGLLVGSLDAYAGDRTGDHQLLNLARALEDGVNIRRFTIGPSETLQNRVFQERARKSV